MLKLQKTALVDIDELNEFVQNMIRVGGMCSVLNGKTSRVRTVIPEASAKSFALTCQKIAACPHAYDMVQRGSGAFNVVLESTKTTTSSARNDINDHPVHAQDDGFLARGIPKTALRCLHNRTAVLRVPLLNKSSADALNAESDVVPTGAAAADAAAAEEAHESSSSESFEFAKSEIVSMIEAALAGFGPMIACVGAHRVKNATSDTYEVYSVMQRATSDLDRRLFNGVDAVPPWTKRHPIVLKRMFRQLLHAVFVMSTCNCVHTDLKLSNIVDTYSDAIDSYDCTGRVYIIDFDCVAYRRLGNNTCTNKTTWFASSNPKASREAAASLAAESTDHPTNNDNSSNVLWKTAFLSNLLFVSCFLRSALADVAYASWIGSVRSLMDTLMQEVACSDGDYCGSSEASSSLSVMFSQRLESSIVMKMPTLSTPTLPFSMKKDVASQIKRMLLYYSTYSWYANAMLKIVPEAKAVKRLLTAQHRKRFLLTLSSSSSSTSSSTSTSSTVSLASSTSSAFSASSACSACSACSASSALALDLEPESDSLLKQAVRKRDRAFSTWYKNVFCRRCVPFSRFVQIKCSENARVVDTMYEFANADDFALASLCNGQPNPRKPLERVRFPKMLEWHDIVDSVDWFDPQAVKRSLGFSDLCVLPL